MRYAALTAYVQHQRHGDTDLRLQTPPITDSRHTENAQIHRHRPQARELDGEVFLLRHVLRAHPALAPTALLDLVYHLILEGRVVPVEELTNGEAANDHPAADGEEAQANIGFAKVGVGFLEEDGDGRGDAMVAILALYSIRRDANVFSCAAQRWLSHAPIEHAVYYPIEDQNHYNVGVCEQQQRVGERLLRRLLYVGGRRAMAANDGEQRSVDGRWNVASVAN